LVFVRFALGDFCNATSCTNKNKCYSNITNSYN
jgi:hypothetical protein